MGGAHLPKYLGSPIPSGTTAREDPCFDESDGLLPGRVGQRASGMDWRGMTILSRARRAAGAEL
jgi:hypothetical protein